MRDNSQNDIGGAGVRQAFPQRIFQRFSAGMGHVQEEPQLVDLDEVTYDFLTLAHFCIPF
jgi:hypothetical protein